MSRPNVVRWLALSALVAGMIVVPATAAWSAQIDPYGGTSTTTTTSPSSSCSIDQSGGRVSTTVTGRVVDVTVGSTLRFFLGDREVHRQVAAPEETGPQGFSGARAPTQTATTDVEFRFEVPDIEPGVYALVVTGATFRSTCATPAGTEFEVLAAADAGIDGGRPGGGSLPFTGTNALVLVVGALAVIGAGVAIRNRSHKAGRSSS